MTFGDLNKFFSEKEDFFLWPIAKEEEDALGGDCDSGIDKLVVDFFGVVNCHEGALLLLGALWLLDELSLDVSLSNEDCVFGLIRDLLLVEDILAFGVCDGVWIGVLNSYLL